MKTMETGTIGGTTFTIVKGRTGEGEPKLAIELSLIDGCLLRRDTSLRRG